MRKLNWKPDEPAQLHVLGAGAPAGSGPQPVCIVEISGRRVRLAGAATVKGGAAVRLEWGGQLLLGQVLNMEPGGFWVEIHHMLLDTNALNWQKQGWQRA